MKENKNFDYDRLLNSSGLCRLKTKSQFCLQITKKFIYLKEKILWQNISKKDIQPYANIRYSL